MSLNPSGLELEITARIFAFLIAFWNSAETCTRKYPGESSKSETVEFLQSILPLFIFIISFSRIKETYFRYSDSNFALFHNSHPKNNLAISCTPQLLDKIGFYYAHTLIDPLENNSKVKKMLISGIFTPTIGT